MTSYIHTFSLAPKEIDVLVESLGKHVPEWLDAIRHSDEEVTVSLQCYQQLGLLCMIENDPNVADELYEHISEAESELFTLTVYGGRKNSG